MAIPLYLNYILSILKAMTHSIAYFIVNSQEALVRTKFIKYKLRDILNYLKKCVAQLKAES
jgi:hypothetical protein